MKISVSKDHITNGVKKNSQHCMIGDAIKERFPEAQHILVDLQTIRFSDPVKRKRYVYLTPAVAQHGILKFDKGDTVKPFTFTLTAPVRTRIVQNWTERRRSRTAAQKGRRKLTTKANREFKKKYAYLAANRALNHQKEREFGLRMFVE